MALGNGYRIWDTVTAVTVAASPVTSAWVEATGFTRALPYIALTGGTTVVTVEGSTDGSTLDTDLTPITLASGTQIDVPYPYIRVKITQTVADSTRTKVYLQARS